MSTFDGIVDEFPSIRIDHFRHNVGRTPPAACFLSHVHSDHILGLDTFKMPFVYCSAATRRLLLKVEKYAHRFNFSKGILEARKQTYRHMKSLLRPLPLETAVDLEIGPNDTIRVTLFDANHCPGAVMFLIEGQGKAILYTGDIRSESWWVNSIVRSPSLIPYVYGLRRLDCLYLDTTFASLSDKYQEFPSKADGLAELAKKLQECPPDSVFYFRAWTLGYEAVWALLSNLLESQVHVDSYLIRLFEAVAHEGLDTDIASSLVGFKLGNGQHRGSLTNDPDVRIHSCEPGLQCHQSLHSKKSTVWIAPIISRLRDGTEVGEEGAGGGGRDFCQSKELELSNEAILQNMQSFSSDLKLGEEAIDSLTKALLKAQMRQESFSLEGLDLNSEEELTIKDFLTKVKNVHNSRADKAKSDQDAKDQQKVIHFPYSRHSSYSELRDLVARFKPKDICPCTVDHQTWSEQVSMQALFGDLCSEQIFKHDAVNRAQAAHIQQATVLVNDDDTQQSHLHTQRTQTSLSSRRQSFSSAIEIPEGDCAADTNIQPVHDTTPAAAAGIPIVESTPRNSSLTPQSGASTESPSPQAQRQSPPKRQKLDHETEHQHITRRQPSRREEAFAAALRCMKGDVRAWNELNIFSLQELGHEQASFEI